jgi:hypothetical protein
LLSLGSRRSFFFALHPASALLAAFFLDTTNI